MKKDIKNTLNEKMQVKLPEALNKENILSELDNTETKIVKMPKKKNMAKKLLPIAASFMVVVGLIGMYFGLGTGEKQAPPIGEGTGAVTYQGYDEIYKLFDELHKESKKENGFNLFYGVADEGVASPESAIGGSSTMADDVAGSKNHGTTNTQEEGVDEGDIIKTDGRYLYIVNSGTNAPVSIVDCANGSMKKVTDITLEDGKDASDIYLYNNRLVVIGYCYRQNNQTKTTEDVAGFDMTDCCTVSWGDTFVSVYDITDKSAPVKVTEYVQNGNINSSRMIGSKLYTISTYYVNVYGNDYRDVCIPEITVNGACEKISADGICVVEGTKSTTYAIITALDVEKEKEPQSEAVLGGCNNLYASSKGLFLSEYKWDNKAQETTKIYRFDYAEDGVEYKGVGEVPGFINNQFSMSYDGEYFRIATTANKVTTDGDSVSVSVDDRVNNLYILNNDMKIVGKVEDLAKGETIQSVRFVGDMAYVVTFRQTDPLFVIDLSNPENPTVQGELKIPGFSEYLHPIADGLLVGVGADGTLTGANGDCKVSLFDVTNPYEPKETASLSVGNGKHLSNTRISINHKLFINLSETEFAVPFTLFPHWIDNNCDPTSYYIRYRLENGTLQEDHRYYLGSNAGIILGGTYIDNTLYVVLVRSGQGVDVMSFDLETHEETGCLQTWKWKS